MRKLFKIKNRVWRFFLSIMCKIADMRCSRVAYKGTSLRPGELDLIKIKDLVVSGWKLSIKDVPESRKVVFTLNKKIGRTDKSVISVLKYEEILANDLLMRSIMIRNEIFSEASYDVKGMGSNKEKLR